MNIDAVTLTNRVAAIFQSAGSRAGEAECVARHLVEANLVGHDSHGVIRVPAYVDWLRSGKVLANQQLRVVSENGPVIVCDGGCGFGQVMGEAAMELATKQGKAHGLAIVALRNSGHLGRIGDWAVMAAEAGLVSLHFVNTNGGGILVAPFGGKERRLSANPIAAGVPVAGGRPIVLDISTCTIAEGKIKVAYNKGERVPDGCLLDANGQPTNDPVAFYANPPGAILPLGGHKGYALGVIVEVLAGALTGGGCSHPGVDRVVNNMLTIVADPAAFGPGEAFARDVRQFLEHVRTCPPAQEGGEILLPGEPEERTRAQRLAEGIPLDERTRSQLDDVAHSLGVAG
jgi:hydroxycarboxylate dehydrogenase B